ncbi:MULTISPECIES: aldehyde dehydrogenase family protein [unclassified Pseudactinotalea]|uniref:aldehyde dehydrogenase family protein n=1 Tax=unclassified Pseudactinotalea TaxID=2649176 RepID=UPI00128E4416|nr:MULTISPECIES: aldehyde dehydrogenase family protein [unclassified Pseudactinotalea]MPV50183.1 aldehyde dehydrogenase family protein [Pseudactinotalea sp. HY160]QGH70233.1 aldehyde dehydrogenase family protein [Pseudactinotalea sp. HY158]
MSATTTSTPMSDVLRLQRAAFHRDGPPDAALRRDRVDRFTHAVVANTDRLVTAISDDFGHRPEVTTLVTDVLTLAAETEVLRAGLGRWMRPRYSAGAVTGRVLRLAGLTSQVVPSPLGVVGVMGMWNFPLNLTAVPALTALAAGNRVMIKMSEKLPRTSEVLANAWHDVFDVEELAVVTGDVAVSAEFASLDLDHLFFTGSAATGSKIMAAAATNLTPVTLELGGKNPVVVSPEVASHRGRLRRSAARVAASRLLNAGQVCLSPDDVYVPASQLRLFVQEVFNAWSETVPDRLATGEVTSLIDAQAYDRVTALIDDAAAQGAQVLRAFGTDEAGEAALRGRRIVPPTIVLDVTEGMRLSREEVFGPVLAVHPYDDVDEVVARLADRPAPLVATWYGKDDAAFRSFVANTRSGGVARNDWGLTNAIPMAPFGGVGQSGMGRYHGRFGFEQFSHLRAVAGSDLPISVTDLAAPPGPDGWTEKVRSALGSYAGLLDRRLRR